MNKNYMKEFRKEIIERHLIIAFISVAFIILLFTFLDYFYDGSFIDFIELLFGWDVAHFILNYRTIVMFIVFLVVIIVNSVLVELYAISKISHVFSSIKVLFQKDDEKIVLDASLKELETDLNHLKQENIDNEKRAIQESQHKVDMIAYLAHDIRTPLASVIGYLNLLEETELPKHLKDKYLRITLEKAYRLENLVDEFFNITKLSQSYVPLNKEEVNLRYFLEQMKEEFYPLLSQRKQTIKLNIDDKIIINVDVQKIARVFNNIIKNAMYYGYQESCIYIGAFQDVDYVTIYFENSGETIPQEQLDSIFEQFVRLDSSRSSSTGGSGLGLSIAKMIVNQHHGFIKAKSYDEKIVFEVILPIKDTF